MGRSIVGLECQRFSVARRRLIGPPKFEQHGPEVPVAVDTLGVQLDGPAIKGYGFATQANVSQHIAEVIQRLRVTGVQRQCLLVARHGLLTLSQGSSMSPRL